MWGTTHRKFQFAGHGRRSCAATCQITREGGAIIDICFFLFLVRLLLIHCMPAGRRSDALQTAGAFVYTHDYRAVHTVQAAQLL